jgi:hypothetical protein
VRGGGEAGQDGLGGGAVGPPRVQEGGGEGGGGRIARRLRVR